MPTVANLRYAEQRALKSEWEVENPVLPSGVKGVETDTGKFKIGNGATTWNTLEYINNGFIDTQIWNSNDDDAEVYTESGELWEMTSPAIVSNLGNTALVWNAERNGSFGFGKNFSGFSSQYFSGYGSYGILPIQLEDEDAIEFWIYPNWGASPSSSVYILDSRQGLTDNDDHIQLRYETSNAYTLIVKDTGGDDITITSSAITNPNSLTHIKIAWSKLLNSASLIIDGVDQGSGTTSGTGITNINMLARSGVTIGSRNQASFTAPDREMNSWLSYFLHHEKYTKETKFYDNGLPLVSTNRKLGIDQDLYLDKEGNFGAKNVSAETGYFQNGLTPCIDIHEASTTKGAIYDMIERFFSYDGQKKNVNGSMYSGGLFYVFSKAKRINSTQINFYFVTSSGVISDTAFTSASATAITGISVTII
jgi:hypothetical protein